MKKENQAEHFSASQRLCTCTPGTKDGGLKSSFVFVLCWKVLIVCYLSRTPSRRLRCPNCGALQRPLHPLCRAEESTRCCFRQSYMREPNTQKHRETHRTTLLKGVEEQLNHCSSKLVNTEMNSTSAPLVVQRWNQNTFKMKTDILWWFVMFLLCSTNRSLLPSHSCQS